MHIFWKIEIGLWSLEQEIKKRFLYYDDKQEKISRGGIHGPPMTFLLQLLKSKLVLTKT